MYAITFVLFNHFFVIVPTHFLRTYLVFYIFILGIVALLILIINLFNCMIVYENSYHNKTMFYYTMKNNTTIINYYNILSWSFE